MLNCKCFGMNGCRLHYMICFVKHIWFELNKVFMSRQLKTMNIKSIRWPFHGIRFNSPPMLICSCFILINYIYIYSHKNNFIYCVQCLDFCEAYGVFVQNIFLFYHVVILFSNSSQTSLLIFEKNQCKKHDTIDIDWQKTINNNKTNGAWHCFILDGDSSGRHIKRTGPSCQYTWEETSCLKI